MKIHVPSALLGAASVIGLGILASAQVASTRARLEKEFATYLVESSPASSQPRTFKVDGIPSPDQLVRIEEGEQYEVPPGAVLIMTGVLCSISSYQIYLNGALVYSRSAVDGGIADVFFWGYSVDAGVVVEIEAFGQGATILGYLEDVED